MKKREDTKAKPQARRRRLDRFVRQDADFLAEQIDAVATLMWALAERMEYFAGFNGEGEMVKHSREMAGASVIARKWAAAIRKPNNPAITMAPDPAPSVDGVVGRSN
jgi:hypothetical protein